MIFDSLPYVIFLTVVVSIYWTLPHRAQNLFLIAASYLFYGWWNWRFLGLIIAVTTADYVLSHAIARSPDSRRRRQFVALSVFLNLSVLGLFKYAHFFGASFESVMRSLRVPVHPIVLHVLLPLGISFYTFEGIAYVVSVYRRDVSPARTWTDYALFIAFFPHLIAGPIMKPVSFLPQCENERSFRQRRFWNGIDFLVWGMVKKVVIADGIGSFVDRVFATSDLSTGLALTGALGFGLQILADFSAYTDMARGSAKLMGFELVHNFFRPYEAHSITEFWRRWHVSLSSWIRDYLYIPLGGSRVSTSRYLFNLTVTWGLCGLWHGAAWKFVAWGLYQGVWMARERLLPSGDRRGFWAIFRTQIVVFLGWLLFRIPSLHDGASAFSLNALVRSAFDAKVCYILCTLYLFFLLPWILKVGWTRIRPLLTLTAADRWELRFSWYALAGVLLLLFAKDRATGFIYFDF